MNGRLTRTISRAPCLTTSDEEIKERILTPCFNYFNLLSLLSETVTLLFEVTEIIHVSPALVTRCGLLYCPQSLVGWKPIFRSWLKGAHTRWEITNRGLVDFFSCVGIYFNCLLRKEGNRKTPRRSLLQEWKLHIARPMILGPEFYSNEGHLLLQSKHIVYFNGFLSISVWESSRV